MTTYRESQTAEDGSRVPAVGASGPAVRAGNAARRRLVPARRRSAWRAALALTRPRQWVKNPVAILLPVVCCRSWNIARSLDVLTAIALFTLACVAVYILNDIRDRDLDRLEPRKKARPLANGEISVAAAWSMLAAVTAVLAAGIAWVGPRTSWPVCCYLLLNIAYSLRLKHVPLIDAFTVALGFALRTEQGFVSLGVRSSPWLLLCVLTACLLLVLGKRRRELADSGRSGHRPALRGYTVPLLDHLIVMNAVLAVVAYLMFVAAQPTGRAPAVVMVATVPFALFALFRYLQLLIVGNGGGDPVVTLFSDLPLIVSLLGWLAAMIAVVALHPRAGLA
jgi:decaprenyl-phosphate phosphoribosyltransferase